MSEYLATDQMIQQDTILPNTVDPRAGNRRIGGWRRMVACGSTALALAGGGAILAACSNSDSAPNFTAGLDADKKELTGDQQQAADRLCPDGFNMEANAADNLKNVGSKESFYPAVGSVDKKGEVELVGKEEARTRVLDMLCTDAHSLAVFTAYQVEPREGYHLPNEKTVDRVNQLVDLFNSNEKAALNATKKAASWLSFLEATDEFVVTQTEATQVTPVRDDSNDITGVRTVDPEVSGQLSGFVIGYDKVSPDTTETEKLILEQIKDLILIDQNGRLIISKWLGEGQANFKPDVTTETTVPANVNEQQQQNQGGGNNAGGGQPHGQGNGCQGAGQGCEGSGPGEGNGPGGPGGGGPEGPGPTTPTTKPTPTTTRPPSTTTTRPPTTTTTLPTTTTTKGPVPCDPNIAKC